MPRSAVKDKIRWALETFRVVRGYADTAHWQTEIDEVIVGGRVKFEKGCVVIPDKPGLGVELDHDQVARGEERYRNLPFRKRDDEAEMRKHVDPNWKRILPRW